MCHKRLASKIVTLVNIDADFWHRGGTLCMTARTIIIIYINVSISYGVVVFGHSKLLDSACNGIVLSTRCRIPRRLLSAKADRADTANCDRLE